jgi:lauroyl/myristoyl acyltransferase
MKLRSLYYSSASIRLGLFLGKTMPRKMGYWLADRIASRLAADTERGMVRALRANLSVVCGDGVDPARLDSMVANSLRSHMRRLFEFYHYLGKPTEIERLIRFSPAVEDLVATWTSKPYGVMILGVHLSAFDMGMMVLARHGLKILALSVPNPTGQYSKQNEIREEHGLEIAPISASALQLARQRLQNNGMVMTGLDRPAPESSYSPKFFGHPSRLPVFHTRLALKTGAPVVVVAVRDEPDGTHVIDCSEKLWMEARSDPREEIIYNTEKILSVAEKFITAQPEKWAMFFPVWPDLNEDSKIAKS